MLEQHQQNYGEKVFQTTEITASNTFFYLMYPFHGQIFSKEIEEVM